MNKRQTEVEKKKLAEEAKELNHLKAIYNKAAEDIAENIKITDGKIEVLLRDWDTLSDDDKSVYQSKIYQKNFQKQLQSQINDVLNDLNSGQYKSIDEYLKKCYETGYIGTMYDIAGQGIPIITPIDQKKVITAMKTNSKISKGLYAKLGEDVDYLQKRIANNISRGIATSDSYENIARNIANDSNVGMNNAMRIARTEGHRIHSNSAHDAQLAAKDAGADIVKQWDSTMDGNTRTTHRLLDGQIREVEEPFEMGGMKAMYPSGFGRPEEDINCRCALLQRATWALDDDELETLKEKAKFHEIYVEDDDKEAFRKQKDIDLNTFTKRYLKATTTAAATKAVVVAPAVNAVKGAVHGKSAKVADMPEINARATNAILNTYDERIDRQGLSYIRTSEWADDAPKGIGANFEGMDIRLADATSKQFKKLADDYWTTCHNISVGKLPATTAPAMTRLSANISSSEITLSKNILKDYDSFMERMAKAVEKGQFPKMDKSNYDKYVITHEFVHTLMDFNSPMKNVINAPTGHIQKARKEIKKIHEEWKDEWRELEIARKKAELDALNTMDEKSWAKAAETRDALEKMNISEYAHQTIDEFMADAFADAVLGSNPSEYSIRVKKVIDKYFKK